MIVDWFDIILFGLAFTLFGWTLHPAFRETRRRDDTLAIAEVVRKWRKQ